MDIGLRREYTLPRSNPISELACASKDNMRIGPVMDAKTTNLSGLHFFCSLDSTETKSSQLFLGTHQHRFQSIRLSGTRFLSHSLLKKQSAFFLVKKILTAWGNPCASNGKTDHIPHTVNRRTARGKPARIQLKVQPPSA